MTVTCLFNSVLYLSGFKHLMDLAAPSNNVKQQTNQNIRWICDICTFPNETTPQHPLQCEMCQQSHDESIDIKDYAKTNSTILNGIPDNAIVNENENEEMNRNNRNAYHCSDYSNYPNEDDACCYTQRRSTTRKYKLTTRRYMHQRKEKNEEEK
eukprot:693404_1